MAFDGIVISALVYELKTKLCDGRITKIAQPEPDELLFTIKKSEQNPDGTTKRTQERLTISVNPSLPLIYLKDDNKPSPLQAPTFCMVLRKHLNNCKILNISQLGLERVIRFDLEHLNEMGDRCTKKIYVELMGKHSNIVFCDQDDIIIDSIKHISHLVSSVREVLPGRQYFIPNTQNKLNPLDTNDSEFMDAINKPLVLNKAIYQSYTGFSPAAANELLSRASLDTARNGQELSEMESLHLYRNFQEMTESIANCSFTPVIYYKENEPKEFFALHLTMYENDPAYTFKEFDSISAMLYDYYDTKAEVTRIHQKSSDLRRITSTALDRCVKKLELQRRQLKDTDKRDKYKEYGDLLTTYGYRLKEGAKKLVCENYYTGKEVSIPLDETMSPMDNAKRYFNKYAKLKRTYEAMTVQIQDSTDELKHLESISNALDIARSEADLAAIKEELAEYGYIKKNHIRGKKNKKQEKTKPFHYISSDGFHMYVGRNNFQNDELTFKFATGNDWWFHAKQNAGSHVIVKTNGEELPDQTFEEAARLAAYYSKSRDQGKAEIDYIQKKHIKKPNGSKPGFVVYYTNYSMTISTDITGIKEVEQ